jgi:hypothetical protein
VTVSMLRNLLLRLQSDLLHQTAGLGPLSDEESASLDPSLWIVSKCNRFAVKMEAVTEFIRDMGTFVYDRVEEMGVNIFSEIVVDTAVLYANAIAGISNIIAEHDANNDACMREIPAVTPQELVNVRPRDFGAIVRLHTPRLLSRWTRMQIDAIEQEHRQVISSYDGEPSLKSSMDAMDSSASFDDSWKLVHNRFKLLEKFCGGIASVFPGTAQVESDFSIVKLEKDDFRMSITDLSLEGVLHAKQHEYLKFNSFSEN